MSYRILVADDSQTIQKVVGITLADTDYELFQALEENELLNSLDSDSFDLLLLDFNLSETQPGFELIKNIREKNPEIPILIMLGTFDNVDDSQMSNYGVLDKIVKPFESTKFLSMCEELISRGKEDETNEESTEEIEDSLEFGGEAAEQEEQNSETDELAESKEDLLEENYLAVENEEEVVEELEFGSSENDSEEDEDNSLGEGWEVDAPEQPENDAGFKIEENDLTNNEEPVAMNNQLENEIEGWGMSMPPVIGDEKSEIIFPPVIEEENQFSVEETEVEAEETAVEELIASSVQNEEVIEDQIMPSDEDLLEPELIPREEKIQQGEDQFDSNQSEESGSQGFDLNLSEEDPNEELNLEKTSGEVTPLVEETTEEMSLPGEDDLSYPDLGNYSGSIIAPTSKLVPINELAPDDAEAEVLEKTDPQLQIPPSSQELANEIEAESNPDEFWAVDGEPNNISDNNDGEVDYDSTKEFKIDDFISGAGAVADVENFEREEENFKKKQLANQPAEEIYEIEVDNEVIAEKIKEQVMPILEELIKEACREKVEQIAWEVIPDLAQNLITKEIKNITDSISD